MPVALREHLETDLAAYHDWQSDPAVATFVSWLPKTRTQSEMDLADAIAQQRSPCRKKYFYAIVEPKTGEVVGDVGFTIIEPGVGDCGWFIRRPFWGQGYATAAARQMITLAFEQVGLPRLIASCATGNIASQRVMQKSGFLNIQVTPSRIYYAMLKKDWLKCQDSCSP